MFDDHDIHNLEQVSEFNCRHIAPMVVAWYNALMSNGMPHDASVVLTQQYFSDLMDSRAAMSMDEEVGEDE